MWRKIVFSMLGCGVLAAAFFFAGPRVDVSYRPRGYSLPEDLGAYLRAEEGRVAGVAAGAEKTIVWAHPDRRRTPLAIVYLHGFSATRQETAPLCDEVAARLGANLYYARLTGHGIDGKALAEATVNDWLNDADEARRIGERLGERVLIVGCSTGAALATWLAAQPEHGAVLGTVLISANFAPRDRSARILTWPWARQLVPRLVGATRQGKVTGPQHERYWTISYPTVALLPMMGLCELVQGLPLERIERPLLMVYSPADQVVDVGAIRAAYARWGATEKTLLECPPVGSETHVIAGSIRAPGGTARIAEAMVQFAEKLR